MIQIISSHDDLNKDDEYEQFASSGGKDDWNRAGHRLLDEKLWLQAILCFQKSGCSLNEKKATAEFLLHEIDELSSSTLYRKLTAVSIECDELHHDTDYLKTAAGSLFYGGKVKQSGILYEKLQLVSCTTVCLPHYAMGTGKAYRFTPLPKIFSYLLLIK